MSRATPTAFPGRIPIACGQCIGCRLDRTHAWAVRCMHEHQMTLEAGRSSSFVTLTYRREELPADAGLRLRDWQLFAKRLRKQRGAFRFLMVGEYGERNHRPHYHALLFGHSFPKEAPVAEGNYYSAELEALWKLGNASHAEFNWERACYVARYCVQKVTGPAQEFAYLRENSETGEFWYVKPAFNAMSKRPGLGSSWVSKYRGDVFPSDECIVEGKRMRTPRYYDSFLSESELEAVKAKRLAEAERRAPDLTPERLRARAVILRGKLAARSL